MTHWMQSRTGRLIDLDHPTPDMIDIEDIAHALSMICRFGGQCRHFYSVAEHSLIVEQLGHKNLDEYSRLPNPTLAMALLLHDSAEAYIGDIITPIKNLFSPGVQDLEALWLSTIQKRFNLGTTLAHPEPAIRQSDLEALSIEVKTLFDPKTEWCNSFVVPTNEHLKRISVMCLSPHKAKQRFLSRFKEIQRALHLSSIP